MEAAYERPTTVSEACALLSDKSVVLAGGTDLLIKLRARRLDAERFVDVKGIAELTELEWQPDGSLVLGAAVTMRRLYDDAALQAKLPALAEGARAVGSLQIQNRATLGGNLCNASPCMDTAPALVLYGARAKLVSTRGQREVAMGDFFEGVKRTVVAKDELLVSISVPASAVRLESGFDKIKRVRGHDLALVNAAAVYDPSQKTLRAALGSCAITPVCTKAVTCDDPTRAGDELAKAALLAIDPIDDVRASAEYRRDMAALLCRRLAARLLSGRKA